ncbi:CoA-binding protein [Rhabdothermincola salaria]|uniref:CoA-binding protein n=1 Tax=Rhabdothermincola salaria TaxID=2903142 RepID=UPI001E2B2345|nr:CoA-binding protein [Rhabdothermincola salaria]MCD9624864.1 CoA-binding protein [Rhabdothermincola salaria]
MPSRALIDSFLDQQHLAVVGVSRNPKDFANTVYRHLRDDGRGRTLYAVNAAADGAELEGRPSYRSLSEVPDPVDGVLVMVPAAAAAGVVRDAVDRGVPRVWLHKGGGPGAVSDEAVAVARDAGVELIDGACPMMFDEPVHGIHRFHRFLAGRRVAA